MGAPFLMRTINDNEVRQIPKTSGVLPDVQGSILEGVVCLCLLLGYTLVRFLFLIILFTSERQYFLSCTIILCLSLRVQLYL